LDLTLPVSSRDWDHIKSPAEDQILPYAKLPAPADHKNLNKLAVLKVNGGLGTSMGAFICSANHYQS
jgi:UDP-N-acetylglucosamine pyrophosphorylase